MRLTLRSLLSFLHGQTESPRTEAIQETVAASPLLSQLARHLEELPERSEISPLPYREKGDGKDPNLVAEYLDYTLEDDAVVKLENQCFQSDRRLLDVVACHKLLTTDQAAPTADPRLLAELYALGDPQPSEKPKAPPQLEARSHRSNKPSKRSARRGSDAQPGARPEPKGADPLADPRRPRRKRPVGMVLLALVAALTYVGAKMPDLWQPVWNSALELTRGAAPAATTSEPPQPFPSTGSDEQVDESAPLRFIDPLVHRVSAELRSGSLEETRFDPEPPSPLPAATMRSPDKKSPPALVGRDSRESEGTWQWIGGLPLTGEKTMVVLPDGWFETEWDNGVRIQVAGGSWFRTADPENGNAAEPIESNNQPAWHLLTGEFHLLLPPERSVTLWYQGQALRFRSTDQPTEIALKTVPRQGVGFDLAQLADNQTLACHLLAGDCQLGTEDENWTTLSGSRDLEQKSIAYQLRNKSWEPGPSGIAQPTAEGSISGQPPEHPARQAVAASRGDLILHLEDLADGAEPAVQNWARRALITLDHPAPFLKRLGAQDELDDWDGQLAHLIHRMRQHPEFARMVRSELANLYPGTGFSVYRLLCGYPMDEATDELMEQLREIETRGLPQLSRVARYQRGELTMQQAP